MAKTCSYAEDCLFEPSAECSCRNPSVFLCEKHLQIHIRSPSTQNHKIKALIIPIQNESKQIILSELIKLRCNLSDFSLQYTNKVQDLVKNIYKKYHKSMGEIKNLDNSLKKLCEIVTRIQEVKLFEKNPPIAMILQHEKESLLGKFKELDLMKLDFLYKGQTIKARIIENVTKAMNKDFSDLVEGKCPNNHRLLLSLDTDIFYKYFAGIFSSVRCNICKSNISNQSLHCRLCFFDICTSCSNEKKYINYQRINCPQMHQMSWIPNISASYDSLSVSCNLCRTDYTGSGWRCQICDYDICPRCGILKGVLAPFVNPAICSLGHKLLCVEVPHEMPCVMCSERIDYPHWHCEECLYSLCLQCSALIGFGFARCDIGHQMVSYKKVKSSWSLRSDCCKECKKKLKDSGFACTSCKVYLCDGCLSVTPIKFMKSN
ncbi:hypothetical protein SteCoe_36826 [Stentor coeruleus]|uniref:ZZ-type domain-containing protein n=1 Tax=Stentor coeruleus TaxID=5963 RepID=A0A1R2APB4_9CILI|nr:hypothetical protein SteCoe_36826 [Stentor coeruleus]